MIQALRAPARAEIERALRLTLFVQPSAYVPRWRELGPFAHEAMYLLLRAGRGAAREALWRLVLTDRLRLLDLSRPAVERSAEVTARYADLPMDLADATLVAAAEERGIRRVFTLDSDFQVHRLHGRQRFDVVPGPR